MKKLWKWLYWNSANILSASRFLTPAILFGPWGLSVKAAFVSILLLGLTDALDGWVARRIGNFEGIGRALDIIADKTMLFVASIWILLEVASINPVIIKMIIAGEALSFSMAPLASILVWKKNQNRKFFQIIQEVLEKCKTNIQGKRAMFCYFSMTGFIYLNIAFPGNEIFFHFYLVSFGVGFIYRVISIGYYAVDLNNWQKEYNSTV